MPSGSYSKRVRNTDSIVNKKNCGGNKKGGLAPRATGPTQFRNVAFNTSPTINFKLHKAGLPCPTNYSNNPGGQCAGGVGRMYQLACRASKTPFRSIKRITLKQALQQGGVRKNQLLFLDNNEGLVLDDDFIVEGSVILNDIKNPKLGNIADNKLAGIFLAENKVLTVTGEIVLGNISTNDNIDIYGIYNAGIIEISGTGLITIGDISSVNTHSHGIFQTGQGMNHIQKHLNFAGAIKIGDITSTNANAFGVLFGNLIDVQIQIGDISGSNRVTGVELSELVLMRAHVSIGNVTNSGLQGNTSGIYGPTVEISGSFTCKDITSTGDGWVSGISVINVSGSVTCGNISNTGETTIGMNINNINGSVTCGNVSGSGDVTGIMINDIITVKGIASCGNVSSTGNANTTGIVAYNAYINGIAHCGNVSSTGNGSVIGIDGGNINGTINIASAPIGVNSLNSGGTGTVKIGDPGNGSPGSNYENALNSYIYGNTQYISKN
jgi:hypothetical protein